MFLLILSSDIRAWCDRTCGGRSLQVRPVGGQDPNVWQQNRPQGTEMRINMILIGKDKRDNMFFLAFSFMNIEQGIRIIWWTLVEPKYFFFLLKELQLHLLHCKFNIDPVWFLVCRDQSSCLHVKMKIPHSLLCAAEKVCSSSWLGGGLGGWSVTYSNVFTHHVETLA